VLVTWQVVGCPFGGQRATWDEVGAYSPRLCPDAGGCRYRQVALVGFDRWHLQVLVSAGAGDKGGGYSPVGPGLIPLTGVCRSRQLAAGACGFRWRGCRC
jgi:hypothetical protein